REAGVAVHFVIERWPVVDAHASGRGHIEQRADVETPRVAVDAGGVLALHARSADGTKQARPAGGKSGGRVVHAGFEVNFSALIAEAAADAEAVAQLVRKRGIDVERLDFGRDALEAANPVGVVFGLEAERDADADAEVHARIQVHHVEHARHDGVFARVPARSRRRGIAEGSGLAGAIAELG